VTGGAGPRVDIFRMSATLHPGSGPVKQAASLASQSMRLRRVAIRLVRWPAPIPHGKVAPCRMRFAQR
jgi:hypothetical protein